MNEVRLIDANALKEKLKPCEEGACEHTCEGCRFRVVTVEDIDNAPTVESDYDTGYQDGLEDGLNDIRPQGEWIVDEDDDILKPLKCSNCGEVAECLDGGSQFLSNFCPNCGADMRIKENLNG